MALNTDLVRNAAPNFATTLANTILISDTSMTLQSATGLPTATAITLVIDATDPVSGLATPNLKEVVTGTLSGSTVSNLLRGLDGTTSQGHAAGANVVMWITANLWNDFQTSYLTQHNQLGTHGAITATSINTTGNGVIGGTMSVTGATTLSGAIGGAGYSVGTISNPYKFSVYRNAAQTSTNALGGLLVQFDTKLFDTGSNVDVVTNKGRFTVPISGFYQINALVGDSTANSTSIVTYLKKNGTTVVKVGLSSAGTLTPADGNNSLLSGLVQMTAGDYYEIWFVGGNATNIKVGQSTCYFEGFLVSAS